MNSQKDEERFDQTLREASRHACLRPFVDAICRQREEVDSFYRVLREAGDMTLGVSTDWMGQFDEACMVEPGNRFDRNVSFGTRC